MTINGYNVIQNIRQLAALSCPFATFVTRISVCYWGQFVSGDHLVPDGFVVRPHLNEVGNADAELSPSLLSMLAGFQK